LKQGCKLIDLITRPQLNINNLSALVPSFRQVLDKLPESRKEEIIEAAEIRIKYDGYIRREQLIADKINRLEHIRIKGKFVTTTFNRSRQKPDRSLQRSIRTPLLRQVGFLAFLPATSTYYWFF
jgi:tRNA U34 5-carboxymethylaminomethyl modifying enzyme MnmG/GidA